MSLRFLSGARAVWRSLRRGQLDVAQATPASVRYQLSDLEASSRAVQFQMHALAAAAAERDWPGLPI